MKAALLSSEVAPFAKTGGLADVTGALPKFLRQLGHDIRVFLPFYSEVQKKNYPFKRILENQEIKRQSHSDHFSVWEYQEGAFSAYFIENKDFFEREGLYGTAKGDYPDNGERFAFFAKASLEASKKLGFRPDIFHCHDWQTAVTLAYLRFVYAADPFFNGIRSLFTIHNLAYQGLFEKEILAKIGLPENLFHMEALEFYGKVNFLKAGILYADAITTVSPRYSLEIMTPEFGCGLDGLLRKRKNALFGILNGVDYSSWSPETDRFIAKKYSADDVTGKANCKADLLQAFELPRSKKDVPIIGMVSRLAGQKGFDLVCESLEEVFKLGIFLVILGTGEEKFQSVLKKAKVKFPAYLRLKIAFDEALSHKIYAGSDIFLIPSRYEPCGLSQMYSLKYGTIPVVRATGGLDDTIQEFDQVRNTGNGFKFKDYAAEALLSSLRKALICYRKKETWQSLVRNAMASDFSWERSAREYIDLYKKIVP